MDKFYMVVGENAGASHGGKFDNAEDAKVFASEASLKHPSNDGYIVLEAIYYNQSTVSVYTTELDI